jgi:hypothetical protein
MKPETAEALLNFTAEIAAGEAMGKSKVWRWAVLPQGRFWKHIDEVPVQFRYTRMPEKSWGEGIFSVSADGSLKWISDEYDTSP